MLDDLKILVQDTGLLKAITDIENELNQGKLIEKEVEAVTLKSKKEQSHDIVLSDDRSVQFKKTRKTKFIGYEPYTDKEKKALISQSLVTGVQDALHLASALSEMCKDFNIEINFDDKKKITKNNLDSESNAIESLLDQYKWENGF